MSNQERLLLQLIEVLDDLTEEAQKDIQFNELLGEMDIFTRSIDDCSATVSECVERFY